MLYALVHPDTLEVRYVGKSRDAAARMKQHRANARKIDYPVYRWWRKVVARDGHEPCLVRLGEGDSAEEITLIAKLRTDGARLLNVQEGGQGGQTPEMTAKIVATRRAKNNYSHSEEICARLAETSRDWWQRPGTREHMTKAQHAGWTEEKRARLGEYNKTPEKRAAFAAAKRPPISTEQRAKISAALKGQKKPLRSDEHRRAIGKAGVGRVATLAARANMAEAQRARRARERKT